MRGYKRQNNAVKCVLIFAVSLILASTEFSTELSAKQKAYSTSNLKEGKENSAREKELGKLLISIKMILTSMEAESMAGRNTGPQIILLKSKKEKISKLDSAIREEFSENRKKISGAGLPEEIIKRLDAAKSGYEKSLKRLFFHLLKIEELKQDSDKALPGENEKEKKELLLIQIRKTLEFLIKTAQGPRHDPLKFPTKTPPEKPAKVQNPPVAGNTGFFKILLDFLVPDLHAATLPTDVDLAETLDTVLSPEIIDTASALKNNPVEIYEYVRNNFKYEPYWGSRKGAREVLMEGGGNDIDLASLLIALYRAAGIPANYARAKVEIPIEKAMKWLGVEAREIVPMIFASNNIPVETVNSGGKISAVIIEHIWVNAYVPFINGRGVINEPGDTWVPLDPSFKEMVIKQISYADYASSGLLTDTLIQFDSNDYLSTLQAEDPTAYHEGKINEYLAINHPPYISAVIYRELELIKTQMRMLSGSLPYKIVSLVETYAELPAGLRYYIRFELLDAAGSMISLQYQGSTPELAGKRITLSYRPASTADQEVINLYGDIYDTPAYLVNVLPELRLAGTVVASGTPVMHGSLQKLKIIFNSPAGESETVENSLYAAGYHAIVLNLQSINQLMLYKRTDMIEASNKIFDAGGTVSEDEHVGEFLNATGRLYFQKLDALYKNAQKIYAMVDVRKISEAIVSIETETDYIFGLPAKVRVAGLGIDVDREIHSAFPIDGSLGRRAKYIKLGGYASSYLEHIIFEELFEDSLGAKAVSAVKLIQLANDQLIPVHEIRADNINLLLPLLQVSAQLKNDIENAINAGKNVIIPEKEITYAGWKGTGYIVWDDESGLYLISGGTGGGKSMNLGIADWARSFINVRYAYRIDQMARATEASIVMFPGYDNRFGTNDDIIYELVPVGEAVRQYNQMVDIYNQTSSVLMLRKKITYSEFTNPYTNNGLSMHDAGLTGLIRITDQNRFDMISKHFYLHEFDLPKGNTQYEYWQKESFPFVKVAPSIVVLLEEISKNLARHLNFGNSLGVMITVNSGYRSGGYNQMIEGAQNSYHLTGAAADVKFTAKGLINPLVTYCLAHEILSKTYQSNASGYNYFGELQKKEFGTIHMSTGTDDNPLRIPNPEVKCVDVISSN